MRELTEYEAGAPYTLGLPVFRDGALYTVGSEPAQRDSIGAFAIDPGVLHRIRSGRHGDGLPDWTSRRAVVGRREFVLFGGRFFVFWAACTCAS